jgi:DNA-binding Lrp family transcriptional regulator
VLQAFVLIGVVPGKERAVFSHVKKLASVTEAEIVYGVYDLILKVQVKVPEALDDFVFNNLRRIDGVKSTTTCICAASIA